MVLDFAVGVLLESLEQDFEALRGFKVRLGLAKRELVGLNESLLILGHALVHNQHLANHGEAALGALVAFSSSMTDSTTTIKGYPTRAAPPNDVLTLRSLPQLIGSDESKFQRRVNSMVSQLQEVIEDAKKISVGASKAIDLVHRQIPITTAGIEYLQRSIEDLEAHVKSKQLLSHPIQRLPIELLSSILRWAVTLEHEQRKENLLDDSQPPSTTNTTTLRSIRLTCRRWFLCVKDDPMLTRAIVLWTDNELSLGEPVPGLEPTTLTVIQSVSDPDDILSWAEDLAQVKWELRSVHLSFEESIVPGLLQQLPHASSLSLDNRWGCDHITIPTSLKDIKSLTCVNILPIIEDNFDELKSLHLDFRGGIPDDLPMETLPVTLHRSPNLTTIYLSTPFPSGSNTAIHLPHLHTLTIRLTHSPDSQVAHFGGRLKCPQLSCLNIVLPDEPNEGIEGLLSMASLHRQLEVFSISGQGGCSCEWARVPPLPALKTLSLEGACSETLFTGFLSVSENGGQLQLMCPVLLSLCFKKSPIQGSRIYDAVQVYRQHRDSEKGETLPRITVAVYDCPNISVEEMRKLRRLRE
jgi:hypothetical protein